MWSNRLRYALRALLAFTVAGEARLSVAEVARGHRIPPKYLEAVLASIRDAGIIESVRGRGGGYRLASDPAGIRIATVFDAVEPGWDGAAAGTAGAAAGGAGGARGSYPEEATLDAVTQSVRDELSRLTLADAAARWQQARSGAADWVI